MPTGKEKKSENTRKLSEPDSDMTQILILLDFKITVINMLKALMEKIVIHASSVWQF